jgi:hypothetical protein
MTLVLSTSWADEVGHPSYAIFEDLIDRVIRIRVEGFFDVATLKRHFAENALVVDRWRSVAMPIRVFIDACDLKPHSPEGQACVQEADRAHLSQRRQGCRRSGIQPGEDADAARPEARRHHRFLHVGESRSSGLIPTFGARA